MKKGYIGFLKGLVLAVAAFGFVVAGASCNSKTAGQYASGSAEFGIPVEKVASVDSLAMFMIEQLWVDETVENWVKAYETQANGMLAHWDANHNQKASQQDRDTVLNKVADELNEYADELSAGSTWDMVISCDVSRAVANFFTARLYCEKYKDDVLYQNEMRDWLALDDAMSEFMGKLCYLDSWGGSIARINAASAYLTIDIGRQKDYEQLHKGGEAFPSEVYVSESRTQLINQMVNLKRFKEDAAGDMSDDEDYNKMLDRVYELKDLIPQRLDAWLDSRAKLSKSYGIPESNTANMVHALGIMARVILTPDED